MTEDWQSVADAINARMTELPINQRDLADRSGVSIATIREIQRAVTARRRSARTLGALSEALGWPEGYLRAVLAGETSPDGLTSGKPAGDLSLVLTRLDQIHGEVRRLAEAVERIAEDGAPTRDQ